MAESQSQRPPNRDDRRGTDRAEVTWSVDCETADTFLYVSLSDISDLGIFVLTREPLSIGTLVTLRFSPLRHEAFALQGIVQWINPVRSDADNPNPGMGIRFVDLSLAERERLVDIIKTIAYLRAPPRILN